MARFVRFLALVIGAIWFLPVSCTAGLVAGVSLGSRLHERHMDKGDAPHSLFHVVWQPGEAGQPFGYSKLDGRPPLDAAGAARSFIMTQPAGRIEGAKSTLVSYMVLESGASGQLIEVAWADDTYGSLSRYRATPAGVTPVFSKVQAPEFMFMALLPALGLSFAILVLGRRLRGRVAPATTK